MDEERPMGVMLQTFYWDCPAAEGREGSWWSYLNSRLPEIARAGFTALWLPPASKAAEWNSMGYDPYDYYDLGEFDQKGAKPTWFGAKADLLALIQSAHELNLQVYADLEEIAITLWKYHHDTFVYHTRGITKLWPENKFEEKCRLSTIINSHASDGSRKSCCTPGIPCEECKIFPAHFVEAVNTDKYSFVTAYKFLSWQ
jgi:hypothetical protein